MKTTYKEYLEQPKHLTIEQMEKLQQQILDEVGDDAEANELYEKLLDKVNRYAVVRGKWLLWSPEERMEKDSIRTSRHDSLILGFDALACYLRTNGKPALWRDELGYEEDDRYNRKRIGDFACYIVFVNSINAR